MPVNRWPVRSSVSTVLTSLTAATHPLQFGVLEFLFDEGGAHLVVGEDRAVVALGGLVELDSVVLDGGGFELLGDALLHIARGLADLEETLVCRVINRVGIDARSSLRLWLKDFSMALVIITQTFPVKVLGLKGRFCQPRPKAWEPVALFALALKGPFICRS